MTMQRVRSLLRTDWTLLISVGTCVVFLNFGARLFAGLSNLLWLALIFGWLFAVILGSALAVVRHAEALAKRLGEPFGTLILTLSVTSIEVMSITAVMLHGANNPTLARDTLFAVTMIILNGMVGLSLLMGGWRHREQQYNLQGANAYLGVIIPLGVLGLVLPNFTITTPGPTLSVPQEMFIGFLSVVLYASFLALQTHRHRSYFVSSGDLITSREKIAAPSPRLSTHKGWAPHAGLLVAYMIPVVFLVEQLAHPVDYVVETMGKPAALGGLAMAILVATPEAIGAVRAASANQLQRSINIFLGSVLSTIGLTIPAILVISELTHHPVMLGLEHSDLLMFVLTLTLCVVTFSSGRTNVLQGAAHLSLFCAYLFLIFQG